MPRQERLSKADALAFILTYIVVEQGCAFELNPPRLFQMMTLASTAVEQLASEEDAIPHEVLEALALTLIEQIQCQTLTNIA
ncbi:MAG: hypothetical protein QNL99_05645 [SAR86 cluster bacterium]|jgi:hypothetical protein|uniref:Uncharacterized protein n=1 Tax=SAR86 cluster bacterium TaxID=2030880 RepID=A0A972VYL4_9GAMM|nr:hypothetical protein [SAR86 cluster bacterium]|tara:strand:+ start:259 stop:504 length:246 start_codon:yes stop_codon:yes gene_type:complete